MKTFLGLCIAVIWLSGVRSAEQLTQSEAVVIKPGGSHTLICTASGFTFSSHCMHWVREIRGKLQWIADISGSGGTTYYHDDVKGRFTISRNNNDNTLRLKMDNVKTEDSALYYCARDRTVAVGETYFDIWGPGTFVTVSPDESIAPQVFPYFPVVQAGESIVKIVCLAKNYFPNPTSVVWSTTSGETLSGEKNTPFSLSGDPPTYSLASQIAVSSSEWKSKNYSCEVKHFSSIIKKYIPNSCVSPPESPSVQILQGSCVSSNDGEVELTCQANNLTSQEASVKWYKNEQETYIPQDLFLLGKSSNSFYGLQSTVYIQQGEWNNGIKFKCVVTDSKTGKSSEASARKCSDVINCLGIEVVITPPSMEDLYIHNTSRIYCTAYNLKHTNGYSFRFEYPGSPSPDKLNVQPEDPVLNDNGTFSVISVLTVDVGTWHSTKEFTCIFSFPELSEPIRRTVTRKTVEKKTLPNIAVFAPPPQDIAKKEMCIITCIVYDIIHKPTHITWLKRDVEISKERYISIGPKQNNINQSFTSSSILFVPCSEWNEGIEYVCLVVNEAIPKNMMSKSISIHSGNSAKVNVSVIMSDTTMSCYA